MDIRPIRVWAVFLFAACCAAALAAPPAPTVTSAANGIKQLRFDWNAVSGATSYELWFQSNSTAAETRFFQMPASQSSVVNNVSVHLLDWGNARYWLNACDSSGCTSSSRISVANRMLGTIGLLSSSSQQASSHFGQAIALSDDGTTLAVAAPFESTPDPRQPNGSVYVYKRSTSGWVFQSGIPLDVIRDGSAGGIHLALNAAGNVLAAGLPGDEHQIYRGNGFGTVKVYRLVPDAGWKHEATIAMTTGFEYGSADWVDLDDAGHTLAVKTSLGELGRFDGNTRSSVYIYTYDDAGSWSHTGTADGHGEDVNDGTHCGRFALSGDGKVLAYGCDSFEPSDPVFEIHAAPDWRIRDTLDVTPGSGVTAKALDDTGDQLAVVRSDAVEIWRRTNGVYQLEAKLRAGAWQPAPTTTSPDRFGAEVRFSNDGKLLAISDPADLGSGIGSLAPPLTAGTKATGAVYVYDRRTNGWTLRRIVKPGRSGAAYEVAGFGRAIAFGDNGKTLAVGHPTVNNNAGAVWIY